VTPVQRPLTDCIVNISISENEESDRRGFPIWQVNRVTLQLVSALFGQGASVAFGHDWREDGVMEAVYGFARQVQPPVPLSPLDAEAISQPLLRNLLPWPEKPRLSPLEQEQLNATLRIESAGLPETLHAVEAVARRAGPDDDLFIYARARGLTFLRHKLGEMCHARLCIGGRRVGYQGRYPGIIEEALLAVRENRPLYLASFLGGAAEQVVSAVEGHPITDDFCRDSPLIGLYLDPPVKEVDFKDDRTIDRQAIWKEFSDVGLEKFATANYLTVEENEELFHTPVVDRVIELVLIGLSRVRAAAN
jgi:hypothetical protein